MLQHCTGVVPEYKNKRMHDSDLKDPSGVFYVIRSEFLTSPLSHNLYLASAVMPIGVPMHVDYKSSPYSLKAASNHWTGLKFLYFLTRFNQLHSIRNSYIPDCTNLFRIKRVM